AIAPVAAATLSAVLTARLLGVEAYIIALPGAKAISTEDYLIYAALGFGFRGGLFFASLFIGSLTGQLFAGLLARISDVPPIDPSDAALIGMAGMAVAIVGGPMTMSLLVLETT